MEIASKEEAQKMHAMHSIGIFLHEILAEFYKDQHEFLNNPDVKEVPIDFDNVPELSDDDEDLERIDVFRDIKNEKPKMESLLTRLVSYAEKLKEYEQNSEAVWSLNRSLHEILDIKDLSLTDVKLPHNVEENIKEVVQSAQEYIKSLDDQLEALDNADKQIEDSERKAKMEIDKVHKEIMAKMFGEINKRRYILNLEAEVRMKEALLPLKACRQEVKAQRNSTENLINVVEAMLNNPSTFSRERFDQIIIASSNIGRIPEVPYTDELPCIHYNRPSNSTINNITHRLSKLGCVTRTGPVRIINIEEKPAALFVNWYINDLEYAGEEHTFVVQRAIGEIQDPNSDLFETVYEGPETSCFIRNLPVNESVTIRVRIQSLDESWSVHRIAKTTIPGYNWDVSNTHYMVTNNGTIAAKLTDELATLFSNGPQFDGNDMIEFKFLETSELDSDNEGIALVFNPEGEHDTLKKSGSLMITTGGKIFMDGEKKLMKLPKIRFGTRIILTSTRKDAHTLRVNVECENTAVTYDWHVKTPLYFAARFSEQSKWNLRVG